MAIRLLERDRELDALASAARAAASGTGRVVLVHGEAGIGKSALVGALRAWLPAEARLLVGWCDALSTPRTLGPLRDLARSVGPRLSRAMATGDREDVLDALHDELESGQPAVLVIEDAHWADDATLDAVRFLARRVHAMSAVLVVTYRDDELDRDHPLVRVLGEVAHAEGVIHLPVGRLSATAVGSLTSASGLDSHDVFALTEGNPYFVTEVVASAGGTGVPGTVVDAVLGRLRGLDAAAQELVEQLAVVPNALDRRLVDALVPDASPALGRAEQRGLLTVGPDRVSFRHELTRRAVVDALPGARRVELGRHALAVFEADGTVEAARVLHQAVEVADVDTIFVHAPVAARDAAAHAAHREAAEHYAAAAEVAERFPPSERADLLESWAVELYIVGHADKAVAAQRRALVVRRELGDVDALGACLRWLSRMHWFAGQRAAAEAVGREATEALENGGSPRVLALALSNEAQLAMLAHQQQRSIELAGRVLTLARDLGDAPLTSHALTNLGISKWQLGDVGGLADLEEAVRVALEVDDIEDGCRAYVGIVWVLLDAFRLDEAEKIIDRALAVAEGSEFMGFVYYVRMERARLEVARGHWAVAQAAAESAMHGQPPPRCGAWTVLGTIRARLGHEGAEEALAEAQALAEGMDELQRLGPVAAARAEAALLRSDRDGAAAIAAPVFETAVRLHDVALQAELAYRLRQAGRPVAPPPLAPGAHPFALQAHGRWREAAAAWQLAGCPYHQAAALADADDDDVEALVQALSILDELGAAPLARQVRGRLRALGVAASRGPAPITREDPDGLTTRQREVLGLLGAGLTNAEIAERLVVSVRTAESHVAAVLAKLGVSSRLQAVSRARAPGGPTGAGRSQ
jgi:DNA-binding CsgD family transcriptional regulator/tetratricopeptide (TPR) repeat protein